MNFTLLRKPALASIEGVLARPCDKKGASGFTGRLRAKMSKGYQASNVGFTLHFCDRTSEPAGVLCEKSG